ncbi:uncharacterized protein LOC131359578 [Hemibagrus wyckioides]|nr:uncharacterized protein LOC131359578 [Hemibagrus wyckioides]
MDVEDEQCDELLCLLEKQEQFADHLIDLAKQLEEMTKAMTKGQLVGNTATVLGSIALVGAGFATYMTAGLAFPLLVKTAGFVALTGTATSLTCKILEMWKSNEAMKNAEKTANEIEEICKKVGESQDLKGLPSDEVGSKITGVILKAMAKTAVKKAAKKGTKYTVQKGAKYAVQKGAKYAAAEGAKSSLLVANKGMSVALKTVSKGAGQFAGGALGLVFTLPDLINNCEELIKDKHQTEASIYLRKTANEIRDAVKQLKKQMNDFEKMLDETSDTE